MSTMPFDPKGNRSNSKSPSQSQSGGIRRSVMLLPLTVVAAFLIAVGLGWFFSYSSSAVSAESQPTNTVTVPETKSTDKAVQDLKAGLDTSKLGEPLPRNLFIELAKLINPAVVSITSTSMPKNLQAYRDPMQEFLEQFWGSRGGGGMQAPRRQAPQAQALGTGFIIREDGLIITNNHVVAQADSVKVQLDHDDNKFYEAEIIGRDALTDIALIKIDAKRPLPVARLGSSKDVQVGEWVAAFGNPYGHAHTMTKGIVSAIGREIAEINRFPFIQTDASINPGNSGGPLVNTQGLVIGVNTAIDARAQGIGFAIPIDNVKQIESLLEKEGRVKRGFIGVGIAGIDENVAQQLGMEEPTGALIAEVSRGGPAEKAGIQPYDIIVEINGKKIANPAELSNTVAALNVGTAAKVKVWRYSDQGKRSEKMLTLTIAENPDDRQLAQKKSKQYFGQKAPFDLGFKISDWTQALAEEFSVPPEVPHGPIVTDIDPQGAAVKAGINVGDVVLDINRQSVTKSSDVLRTLKKGRNIIRLVRSGMVIIVSIGS